MKQKYDCVSWKTKKWKTLRQSSTMKKRIVKSEDTLSDLWDNLMHTNIHIIRVLERRERGRKFILRNNS